MISLSPTWSESDKEERPSTATSSGAMASQPSQPSQPSFTRQIPIYDLEDEAETPYLEMEKRDVRSPGSQSSMEAETPQLHGILPAPALSLTAPKVKKMPKRPEVKRMPTLKGSLLLSMAKAKLREAETVAATAAKATMAKAAAPRATATKSKPKPASGSTAKSKPKPASGSTSASQGTCGRDLVFLLHHQCRRSWWC